MTRRAAAASFAFIFSALIIFGCASDAPSASEADPVATGLRAPQAEGTLIHSTDDWSFAGADGRTIRTANHRIFTTENDASLTRRLPQFLEQALSHYRTVVAPLPSPDRRLDTYLMATRSQWRTLAQQLLGDAGRRFTSIQRGGFATRGIGVFYNIGLYDTFAIAAHEGWHQYAQRVFAEPLPVWLDEGLAAFMEGHKWDRTEPLFLPWANIERFDHLRRAEAKGWLRPLPELLETSPDRSLEEPGEATLTYYAQVWALAHFLNEGADGRYRDALRAALIDAADGRLARTLRVRLDPQRARRAMRSRRGPAVFIAYFDEDLSAAADRYDRFIEKLIAPGSRNAVVAGRSPFDSLP